MGVSGMNRDIKFRVWDIANKQMVYEPDRFEDAFDDEKEAAPSIYYETWQDRDDGIRRPCHVMQYTGLRDKNGKEVWEGDVCKAKYPGGNGDFYNNVIRWSEDEFGWNLANSPLWTWEEIEVMGNIYEHPELLK